MAIFKPNVLGGVGKLRRTNVLGNAGVGYAKRHAFTSKQKLKNLIKIARAMKSRHVSGSTLDIERVRRFSPSQQRTAARAMRRSV